jgi:hypothetical protein
MRFSAATLATVFAASGLVLAQTTDITYMPGAQFRKYHTYTWVAVQGRQHSDPSKDLRIKEIVDSQLATKNFVKNQDRPDLDIDYQIALSKSVSWEKYQDFEARGLPKRNLLAIDKGSLVLDMYDTASKKLVWTGRAERYIDPKGGMEQMSAKVEKAVDAMLAHFPPN